MLTRLRLQINDFPIAENATSLDDLSDGLILWRVLRTSSTTSRTICRRHPHADAS